MIITLNGIGVNEGGVDGLSKIKVKLKRKDTDKKLSRGFTSELTFYGAGWEIIKTELIDNPEGKFNSVEFKAYDDCCEGNEEGEPILVFEGIIRGDSIDWCEGECFVKAQAIEHTEETKKFDCVKSTLIFDNQNGFQEEAHPRMVYCLEYRPSAMQDFVLICGIIINIMFLTLYPIVFAFWLLVELLNALIAVINLIVAAVNTIPFVTIATVNPIDLDGDPDTNLMQEWQNLVDLMNEAIMGCGRVHPSPLVRRYIENACEICGIGFESSIFTDPDSEYFNTVYFNAPVEKGTRDDDVKYIDDNKPLKSLEGFLSDLAPVFSAEYRVIDGVMRFEREDFFYQGDGWTSYDQLKTSNRIIEVICYSWRDEEAPAYGRFAYTDDPVDWVGNEARKRYNDIVEFNQPLSELQKGSRETIIPFGSARHRGDGIDRDVLGDYDWWFLWTDILNDHDEALIMNAGTGFQPKLLIWDGLSIEDAKVKTFPETGDTPADEAFNRPYWFDEIGIASNTGYPTDHPNSSLYTRFHSWKHPKVLADRGLEFTFTTKFDCELLNAIDLLGVIDLPVGTGRVNEVEIDFESRLLTITGHV